MMTEQFREIKGYENLYQVTSFGRIYCIKRKRFLKPYVTNKGYARVDLYIHGTRKHQKVHRLVAQAFIPNPDNKPQINHIDFDKLNNHVENLEWCTNDENQVHAAKMRKENK